MILTKKNKKKLFKKKNKNDLNIMLNNVCIIIKKKNEYNEFK
jgi:hypothetical protein